MRNSGTMKYLHEKLLYRMDDIQKIWAGEFPWPKTVDVNLTDVCNISCVGCHTFSMRKPNGFMPLDVFKKNCDDWVEVGVKGIILTGGGEPTMHPQFDDVVYYAQSKGIQVGVITNGTIFRKSLRDCFWVRVSLYSPDERGHEAHTGTKTYKKVIENVKKIQEGKTKLGLKFLLGSHNSFTEEAVKVLCDALGVKYYDIKYIRSTEEQIVDREKVKKPCGITQIKAVIDHTGTYHICPFYPHHPDSDLGKNIKDVWGSDRHKEVIKNIKGENCAKYDCCLLDIDWAALKAAEVNFV